MYRLEPSCNPASLFLLIVPFVAKKQFEIVVAGQTQFHPLHCPGRFREDGHKFPNESDASYSLPGRKGPNFGGGGGGGGSLPP